MKWTLVWQKLLCLALVDSIPPNVASLDPWQVLLQRCSNWQITVDILSIPDWITVAFLLVLLNFLFPPSRQTYHLRDCCVRVFLCFCLHWKCKNIPLGNPISQTNTLASLCCSYEGNLKLVARLERWPMFSNIFLGCHHLNSQLTVLIRMNNRYSEMTA